MHRNGYAIDVLGHGLLFVCEVFFSTSFDGWLLSCELLPSLCISLQTSYFNLLMQLNRTISRDGHIKRNVSKFL